ncbi:hypothetical protein KJ671_01200 [Patescibacteria group bacterium]|nr:hypothetical protein [Patescibacteria group bacterium]
MKNKKTIKYPILILVIFCLFFGLIQTSFAQDAIDQNLPSEIGLPTDDKTIPKNIPEKIQEDRDTKEGEKIVALECPTGSYQTFVVDNAWWQTVIKAQYGFSLGDASKPTVCLEKGGKIVDGQFVCDLPKMKYYDPKNPNQILGCIVPPTKIVRAKDLEATTDLSNLSAPIVPYEMRVEIPCNPSLGECPKSDTPAGYIARLYQFGLMIAGLTALLFLILGAVRYTLSAGNFASKDDAKDQMLQAILGLALLMGAYLILYTINPNLVNLANPSMEVINLDTLAPTGRYIDEEQNNTKANLKAPEGCIKWSSAGGSFGASVTIGGDESKKTYGTGEGMECDECAEGYELSKDRKCIKK